MRFKSIGYGILAACLLVFTSAAITPEAFGSQADAQVLASPVKKILNDIKANPLPYLKAVHLLFYLQAFYFKIVVSAAFLAITVFLFSVRTVPLSRVCIKKMSDFAVPITLLNLGIAMLIFSATTNICLAMPAIAIALLSSFCGYFVESCLDDLILED